MNPRANDSLFDLSTAARRLRAEARRIAAITVVTAALAGLGSFLLPNKYTSITSFTPEARQSTKMSPSLLGIASQFGVNLGDEGNDSPAFYADLGRSREVMTQVLYTLVRNYRSDRAADSTQLIDVLRVRGSEPALRLDRALERLDKMVSVITSAKTGVVTIRVTTRWAGLSREVGQAYLRTINRFNTERRTSQAAQRREFLERRSREVERELRASEDSLRLFQIRNRVVRSPNLQLEQTVLERQISINESIYSTVRRELETARVDELNDTPLITVIDRPSLVGRHSSPKRLLITCFAAVLGLIGSAGVVVGRTSARPAAVAAPTTPLKSYDVARR